MNRNLTKILCLCLVLVLLGGLSSVALAANGDEYYYANKYLWYNEDGTLKTNRTEAYINSAMGEWEAAHNYIRTLGEEDEMSDAIVNYWLSYGMKKELYHADDPNEAKYAVYSPMYQPEGKTFPLLVVCHGGGSTIYGAEQFGFIEEAAKRGYIALFISWMDNPYTEASETAGMTSEAYTFKKAYDEVIQNYPVDTTRVYVAGFSGGGNATAYIGSTWPDLVAAIMPSTGAGIQGSAARTSGVEQNDPLARAKEIGLPLFMGYGLNDNENRWPVSDKLTEMGPHTDTTVEDRLAFLNEWMAATGTTMEPTTMAQLDVFNAIETKTNATEVFGLNFQNTYSKEMYGHTYLFGESYDANGNVVVRFMGAPESGHQLVAGYASEFCDFAENFYRDPDTKQIVVKKFEQDPTYYPNKYVWYDEEGNRVGRFNDAYIDTVYGEFEALNSYLQSLGAEDEMDQDILNYWMSCGMKKEMFHAGDENEAKYAVYTPMYLPDEKVPLLVVCHGGGQNIFNAEAFGFIQEAAKRGYIALFISWMDNPYGDAAEEAGMTSEAYTFKKAYDEVIANSPIDTTRVYVAGFSGGGNATAYIGSTWPDFVAAIMPSTGAGIQGSAARTSGVEQDDPLARAKEIGLPLFMGYGLEDNENRWPVSDKLQEMGPHTDTTVEDRLAFLNEWVEATHTVMEPTTMTQLDGFNAAEKDSATNIFGLNFQDDYVKTLYGYDYYFGDGYNADGQVVLRFMGVPLTGHNLTMGWAGQFLDFAEHFSRDPETHEILVDGQAAVNRYAWEANWSAEYVRTAKEYGWINADERGNISFDKDLTRAEYAVMLWRALGCPDSTEENPFTDVEDETTATAVTALNGLGIALGDGEGNFFPDRTLTREEGITFLARAFGLEPSNPNAAASFSDWSEVSDWAQNAFSATVEKGIVNGIGDNLLAPAKNITLGEMAKLTVVAAGEPANTLSADDAIVDVKTIGFVDVDGAKVKAIAVEYNVDLSDAVLGLGSYDVWDFGISKGDAGCDMGSNPGVPVKLYVNDKPEISETGGSGSGKYVIIEVNTDYMLSGNITNYNQTMNASVKQIAAIQAGDTLITPNTEAVANYSQKEATRPNGSTYMANLVNADGYLFPDDISVYQLFTREDGTAFKATNCFSQLYGDYQDYDLPYSIYVPEDYSESATNQKFGLALIVHPGSNNGTDPMLSLTGSRAATVLAREDMQQIVKDQGLDGLIVLVPQIETQDAHDNWSFDYSLEAVWQLVDATVEKYPIDEDHIYATGMSMGGIYVVAMAAQRDNFFAGVWANGAQFGNNYNLGDLAYDGLDRFYDYEVETDPLIWSVDADGNPCDYRNWYYMISDDNFLITNMTGDTFSTHMWQELAFLYKDLAEIDIPHSTWNPLTETAEAQNNYAKALFTIQSDRGFYWDTYEGGSHPQTWKYSNVVESQYEWLLTQSRDAQNERAKLDLNKPFQLAENQIQTKERYIMDDADGNPVYYVTGVFGSGTADYNSTIYAMGGNGIIKRPNWKP